LGASAHLDGVSRTACHLQVPLLASLRLPPWEDQQVSIHQLHAMLITWLALDRPQHIEESKTLRFDQDSG